MAIDIPMPKLGLTMEEATIIEWRVADGDVIEADSVIMLIETDKTETEVGSVGAGRIHIIGQPGEVFKCGERIGVLLAEGEAFAGGASDPATSGQPAVASAASGLPNGVESSAASDAPSGGTTQQTGRLFASPNARRVAAELGIDIASVRGSGPDGRIVSEDVELAASRPRPPATAAASSVAGTPAPAAGGIGSAPAPAGASAPISSNATAIATVAARNLADLLGIDLSLVPIDAVERRVTRDGVARYVRDRLSASGSGAPGSAGPPSGGSALPPPPAKMSAPLLQQPTKIIPLRAMRGTIAKRMHASLQEMAQLTLTMDADMTAVLADREGRKAQGVAPSITDYIVAASARALVRHPGVNAQVTDDGIALLPEIHVGLAVAVTNGLLVPVIRNTPSLSLTELASESGRLVTAARSGSSSPADLEGGTFSVTALGAFGVDAFTPVINPPNAAILGVGRLRDDLSLVGERVVATKRLTLSLTWDHRVIDGVPAAEFCSTIVELLATPSVLD
jgi:pyruvate dehydrogenase E2 component (dihydrolipoamide acetyltransferase)